ncbi:iron ABC transporter permease [Thermodesulfovibrionales bacterium]|nr:iron ABC transporter permease [Thermodesulfovibrionales bacterium]
MTPLPHELYSRFARRKVMFLLASLAALAAISMLAVFVGGARLTVGEMMRAMIGMLPFVRVEIDPGTAAIVQHLRLPRIVMGMLAGAGLAIAGGVMQGALRNPLVSSFTMGVASGAALGASVAIILGFSMVGPEKYMVIVNAFIFALGTTLLILALGRLRGVTPESFILVGIALLFFFGAVTASLQYVATEAQLTAVIHWTFGTLTGSAWENILIVLAVQVICLPLLIKYSWDLNTMASGGDEVATSLGINCGRVRVIVMVLAALITATIISFTGIIGFVCLVAPHITRLLIGSDHRFLLPGAALVGATLLLAADTIGRTVFSPVIIPVGIVISFVGAPFFFFLLMSRRRAGWQ